jgi:hypothetical protein
VAMSSRCSLTTRTGSRLDLSVTEAERVAAEMRKAAAQSARDLATLTRGTETGACGFGHALLAARN